MDEDSEAGGIERRQPLAHEGRDDTGEHVAGSTGGHARIAGRVVPMLLAVGDERLVPLEDNHQLEARCHLNGGLFECRAILRRIATQQPAEFAFVRREYARSGRAIQHVAMFS